MRYSIGYSVRSLLVRLEFTGDDALHKVHNLSGNCPLIGPGPYIVLQRGRLMGGGIRL